MGKRNSEYYLKDTMPVYESRFSKFLDMFFKNQTRIEAAAKLNFSGKSCLDLACGKGELINKYLHKRYNQLDGVDVSPVLIKHAKSTKRKNTTFHIYEIEAFIDKAIANNKKYDDIYMLAILEHVQWPSIVIKKIKKILNKNGRLIIETPNVAWLVHRFSLMLGKFPTTAPTKGVIPGVYDEHLRFFTFDTMKKIMTDTGFRQVKSSCTGKFLLIKSLFPSLLSSDIFEVYEK